MDGWAKCSVLKFVPIEHAFEATVVDIQQSGSFHFFSAGGSESLSNGMSLELFEGLQPVTIFSGSGLIHAGHDGVKVVARESFPTKKGRPFHDAL